MAIPIKFNPPAKSIVNVTAAIKGRFWAGALCMVLCSATACRNDISDLPILSADSDDTTATETETHYYVLDTDSEIVDWHYDTADGTGGPDEACYSRPGNDGLILWCDFSSLIAQKCNSNETGCCCRQACQPSLCHSDSGPPVPCSSFDLSDPLGYCSLPEDDVPVTYTCKETCTPRSVCSEVAEDGSCLDSDAPRNGLCLLYDMDTDVKKCCQKSCQMDFCDGTHMCIPIYNAAGQLLLQGTCEPIAQ